MGASGRLLGAGLCLLLGSGCALWRVEGARPGDAPRGVRVFPPSLHLLVGAEESALLVLPDLCRPYDIRPFTWLARQDLLAKPQRRRHIAAFQRRPGSS